MPGLTHRGQGGLELRDHPRRRRLLTAVGVLFALAAVGVAITDPFAGGTAGSTSFGNGSPTSTARVVCRSLVAQTPVSATLGYAGSWTVSVPSVGGHGGTDVYTMLPSPGAVVGRGQRLYAIDGQPVLLLYGSTPAWRDFRPGMSAGIDVGELNSNLRALGYGASTGDVFTSTTAAAISRLQQARGLAETGALLLGSVVFEPGPLRVTTVSPTPGQTVQPGPLLTASSTQKDVVAQLDEGQQTEVRVGDRVAVTLPDNSTTRGVVSSVGKVATLPPAGQSGGGAPGSATIEVDIRLLDPKAAGRLDQAPVDVSITTARVRNVLVVPVDALVALAGGGYAVEEVEADGTNRLVAVTPGLFDDAQGLVQVSGNGLAPGQRVVVPAS